MSWDNLWTFFKECTDDLKIQIWEQLDLYNFITHKPYKIQYEILAFAPMEIVSHLRPLLKEQTLVKLGLISKPQKKTNSALEKKLRGYFLK